MIRRRLAFTAMLTAAGCSLQVGDGTEPSPDAESTSGTAHGHGDVGGPFDHAPDTRRATPPRDGGPADATPAEPDAARPEPDAAPLCVPSPEICNGEDDDCDGAVDEVVQTACGDCDPACPLEWVDVLRGYQPDWGDHMSSYDERELGENGYHREPQGDFRLRSRSTFEGAVRLYRCYSGARADHMLSDDPDCEAEGYVQERVMGWMAAEPLPDTRPLHRFYNHPLDEHYSSTDGDEVLPGASHDTILGHVW